MIEISTVKIEGIDISNIPTLTQKEIRELIKKIHQNSEGSQDARDKLVKHNLRLVLSVVKRFRNRGEDIEDLFQIGCIGLINAINRFNLDFDIHFSTYAIPMIDGVIRRSLRDHKPLKIPRPIQDLSYQIQKKKNSLFEKLLREPTTAEIAKELNISQKDLALAEYSSHKVNSLFEVVYDDSDNPIYMIDNITDQKEMEGDWVNSLWIKENLNKLKERERYVIEERYFKERTQMEIADSIGIAQPSVGRIERRALNKLKEIAG